MLDLQSEFDRLNAEQQQAVLHDGNMAVLAGPGSGKTATLVIKVAHLLSEDVREPQRVACITVNNDAVGEFRSRLAKLGIHAGPRLYLGSVHSFCLNCIVRPFGRIADPSLSGVRVAAAREAERLLEQVATRHIPDAFQHGPTITRLRRRRVCGEDISGFDDRDLLIAEEYERTLSERGLVDFEAMVLRSVELVERHDWIRRLIAARYPRIVIDEYQDLGGPLHRIVTALVDRAGIKVFAVGDPDQTIYEFTGASPAYLRELMGRRDFSSVALRFNYRSGGDLILAGQAALSPEEPRSYEPDPARDDRGRVEFVKAEDSLESHAQQAASAVRAALDRGVPAHEIAIFYRNRYELLPQLRQALADAEIPHVAERDSQYPPSLLTSWLQEMAAWALSPPSEREATLADLVRPYRALMQEAALAEVGRDDLLLQARLYSLLRSSTGDMPLGAWLAEADRELGLGVALSRSAARSDDDRKSLEELLEMTTGGARTDDRLRDFAEDGRILGKIVLTTLHSAKGRQFDEVVLPGLVEGVMPPWPWSRARKQAEEPTGEPLCDARRKFYVGFTRARNVVHLIYSKGYVHRTSKGRSHPRSYGVSRFAKEIAGRLKQARAQSNGGS